MAPEVQIMVVIMGALAFSSTVWARVYLKVKRKELETGEGDIGSVVDALRDDVDQLVDMQEQTRAQLAETQERLDFTERLLAAKREQIGPGSQS